MTSGSYPAFFRGMPEEELAGVLARLERRAYPAGSILIAEGDQSGEIYIVQSGNAEVFASAPDGGERRVGSVVSGGTVGEMSVLTGQPAVATVRATTDLEVLVLPEAEFGDLAAAFPEINRNLGAILSERLARTDRLVAGQAEGRLVVLETDGAPPLLGYALASSIAWHTRQRTLLLVLAEEPADELAALVTIRDKLPWRSRRGSEETGADLGVERPTGPFAPDALPGTIAELFRSFDHVLVQVPPGVAVRFATGRVVRLEHPAAPRPETDGQLTLRAWADPPPLNRPDLDSIVSVPALSSDDEGDLRAGVLTNRSAAGRAVGWAARDVAGLKVGLALGAGSMRGYAHPGVLEVLERAGVRFDYLAGTSIGAALAALVSIGTPPDRIAQYMDEFSPHLFRLTVPIRGLLSNRAMRGWIQGLRGDIRFDELPMPLAVVGADILTRRELVFRRGLVWPPVLAAVSIPGIYPAQRIGPHVVVDGGVVNPVPTDVAATMGAGVVIAVRLGGGKREPEYECEGIEPVGAPPSAIAVLLRALEMMQGRIASGRTEATTITIAPRFDGEGMTLRKFSEGRRFVQSGVDAAEAALPRIRAALPWLRV